MIKEVILTPINFNRVLSEAEAEGAVPVEQEADPEPDHDGGYRPAPTFRGGLDRTREFEITAERFAPAERMGADGESSGDGGDYGGTSEQNQTGGDVGKGVQQ